MIYLAILLFYGVGQEMSESKFAVNLLFLFPVCVLSWNLWWRMFRARELGLGFRLGVGRQGTIPLPPPRSAKCVCACAYVSVSVSVCMCMHYPCSVTSLQCVVDKVFMKTCTAPKWLCRQSTLPALEGSYGANPQAGAPRVPPSPVGLSFF